MRPARRRKRHYMPLVVLHLLVRLLVQVPVDTNTCGWACSCCARLCLHVHAFAVRFKGYEPQGGYWLGQSTVYLHTGGSDCAVSRVVMTVALVSMTYSLLGTRGAVACVRHGERARTTIGSKAMNLKVVTGWPVHRLTCTRGVPCGCHHGWW